MYKRYLERISQSPIPPTPFGYHLIDVPDDKTYRTIDWEKLKKNLTNEFIKRVNVKFNTSDEIRALLSKYYPNLPQTILLVDPSPLNDGNLKTRFQECFDITLDINVFTNKNTKSGSKISHISFHSPEPIYTKDKGCIPWPKNGNTLKPGTAGLHYIVHQFIHDQNETNKLKEPNAPSPTIRFVPNYYKKDTFELVTNASDLIEYEKNKFEMYSSPECVQSIADYNTYSDQIKSMKQSNEKDILELQTLTNTIHELLQTTFLSKETSQPVKLYDIIKYVINYFNPRVSISVLKDDDDILLIANYFDKQDPTKVLKLLKRIPEHKTIDDYLTANYIVENQSQPIHDTLEYFFKKNNSVTEFDKNFETFIKENEKIVNKYETCNNDIYKRTQLLHNGYAPGSNDGYLFHDYLYKCIAETLNELVNEKKITYDVQPGGFRNRTHKKLNKNYKQINNILRKNTLRKNNKKSKKNTKNKLRKRTYKK